MAKQFLLSEDEVKLRRQDIKKWNKQIKNSICMFQHYIRLLFMFPG